MAQGAIVSVDNLREAGIAASIAANPNLLPEPSVYFQDFNFGATMWDAAYGNVDGGSVSGVGASVADVAIEERMKLETEERKKDDPAGDASMIVELGKQQREEAVRFANGTFYFRGMEANQEQVDDALIIARDIINERADREGWSTERRSDALNSVDRAANAGGGQAQAEELGRMNPDAADAFGSGLEIRLEGVTPEQYRQSEIKEVEVEEIADNAVRFQATAEVASDLGYETVAEGNAYAERRDTIRTNDSIGDNPFADTRSSAESFNPAAQGEIPDVQLAENAVPAPSQTVRLDI